jgi:hypothetical protein
MFLNVQSTRLFDQKFYLKVQKSFLKAQVVNVLRMAEGVSS